MLTKAPRGTKDILPQAVGGWHKVENEIRRLCAVYGYEEIRTPTFEHTELFTRAIGENTDVVDKEMYTFTDRGERSITLRPENTASAVRAYLENKLYAEGGLTKLFYIGSMFRYDRPQAGRMREFHQFGVEAIGEQNPAVDAEVILLAVHLLKNLGLTNLTVSLNSVGCPVCRAAYREKLQEYFRPHLDELCHDCQERFERAPMRILDCKKDAARDFLIDAPKITDNLCDECAAHFAAVKDYLTTAGLDYTVDSLLVRGLDYYTKTAFEIKYPPLGAQSAIAGGGRYDGLIAEIGEQNIPAVGFATGIERILLAMEKQNLLPAPTAKTAVFVVNMEQNSAAFALLAKLRAENIAALSAFGGKSLKSQMKQADKYGAKFAVIIGEDEAKNNTVTLKDMATGEQTSISAATIVTYLKEKLAVSEP